LAHVRVRPARQLYHLQLVLLFHGLHPLVGLTLQGDRAAPCSSQ
jgi:hypothetical protein